MKPDVLKPDVLKPDVLWVYRVNSWFLLVHCSISNVFFQFVKRKCENRTETCWKFVSVPRIGRVLIHINLLECRRDHNEEYKIAIFNSSPIIIISPIYFYLQHVENCKKGRSTETHFKSSKSSRGSYLDLMVSTFVKIFEFYLVTKSLSRNPHFDGACVHMLHSTACACKHRQDTIPATEREKKSESPACVECSSLSKCVMVVWASSFFYSFIYFTHLPLPKLHCVKIKKIICTVSQLSHFIVKILTPKILLVVKVASKINIC